MVFPLAGSGTVLSSKRRAMTRYGQIRRKIDVGAFDARFAMAEVTCPEDSSSAG